MRGIVLAGGKGTRLYPVTKAVSKQLLPVYDKPLIYYPLSLLMLAGIREICLISNPEDLPAFKNLLGTGSHWGLDLTYLPQAAPNGIAEAFLIAEKFIDEEPVCLVLGDNIFYGQSLQHQLLKAAAGKKGATLFGYYVKDPQRYGVAEFDREMNVISIEEKPSQPKSNYAVTGLYFYDAQVCRKAKTLKPSARGELEITDLNNLYLQDKALSLELLGRGSAWLDTGTHESLLEASLFVQVIEKRQGLKIACLEEIAYRKGFIGKEEFRILAENYLANEYGEYLKNLVAFL